MKLYRGPIFSRYYSNPPRHKEIKIIGRNITNEDLEGTNWWVADGENGTDNLIDRFFVVAGGDYNVGDTGGAKEVTLTQSQMPSHSHTGTVEAPAEASSTGTDVAFNVDGYYRAGYYKKFKYKFHRGESAS